MSNKILEIGDKIPEFDFAGIKKITIPKTDDDFTEENGYGVAYIKKYMSFIMSKHAKNQAKIDFLYKYYLGKQDILKKERPHKVDKYNNNIIVENHANRQVEFKVGFISGEKRDYTHKSDSDSDDLIYLDRYFTDCNFFSKDKNLKKWIYATGIGVTYTAPRTDIIVSDGVDVLTGLKLVRYATPQEGFDVNYNAPFTFDTVDPRNNFVVYSSNFDNTPLFCVSIVDVDVSKDDEEPDIRKQMYIETRYATIIVQSDSGYKNFYWDIGDNKTSIIKPKAIKYLPMIEYSTNDDRLGIIEKNRSLFNSINTFRSAIADMTTDSANAILVFKNTDVDAKDIEEMKKAGAVVISDSQTARQGSTASIDTISLEIPFDGLNAYIDQLIQNCYDIAGVPLASGQVTSGGDTGQARLLGGGWNNAYIIIANDINSLVGCDYDELKLILLLCKQVPNCPLNELFASQVDISYRVNQNDNFLIKTQGMMYLYQMNMPLEFILKVGKLSNDTKTDAKDWQKRIDEVGKQEEHQIDNNSSE